MKAGDLIIIEKQEYEKLRQEFCLEKDEANRTIEDMQFVIKKLGTENKLLRDELSRAKQKIEAARGKSIFSKIKELLK